MIPLSRVNSAPEDYASAQSRYPQLDDALHTREGFVASVNPKSDLYPFIFLVFVVGVIFLIAGVSMSLPFALVGVPWWQALLWSGANGTGPDALQIVVTWFALALIVIGIVWAVMRQVRRQADANRLFDEFLRGGFLAQLTPIGIIVKRGKGAARLFAFASPDVPTDTVIAAIERLRTTAADSRIYVFHLGKFTRGPRIRGRSLSKVDDSMPDGVFVVSRIGLARGSALRVAIPVAKDPTTVALYALNRGVSI